MNFILLILLAYLVYMLFVAGSWIAIGLLFILGALFAFTGLGRRIQVWNRRRNFSERLRVCKLGCKSGGFFSREREIEALWKTYRMCQADALNEPGPEATEYDRMVFEDDETSYSFYEARRRLISYGLKVA